MLHTAFIYIAQTHVEHVYIYCKEGIVCQIIANAKKHPPIDNYPRIIFKYRCLETCIIMNVLLLSKALAMQTQLSYISTYYCALGVRDDDDDDEQNDDGVDCIGPHPYGKPKGAS